MLQICSNLLKTAAPTQSSASPASMELEDFVRDIVCSMRRLPEKQWNDVKLEMMLVIRAQPQSTGTGMGYRTPAAVPPVNPNNYNLGQAVYRASTSTTTSPSQYMQQTQQWQQPEMRAPETGVQYAAGVTSSVTTGTTATVTDTRGSDVGEFLFQL